MFGLVTQVTQGGGGKENRSWWQTGSKKTPWFSQLNKQPNRLKKTLEKSRLTRHRTLIFAMTVRNALSVKPNQANFNVFICSSKYESFQVIFTNGSLVQSRPRRFRMWRHLPSLSGKFACSGNSHSANWPGYEAAPTGTVRIRSWPDVKFCAHAQCVL